jgi:3-hydroxyacyl-CoA dehydrogenase
LDGVAPASIERAARNFGMPMGPLLLYDMIGLDTAYYAGRVIYEAFPDRTVVSPVVGSLIKAGRKGQKTGAGFYSFARDPERGEPDPKLAEIIAPYLRPSVPLTPEQITARLFLPMLLEATRELADGIANDPRDIDLALIHGIGFPPFKGGLLFWAQNLGLNKILEMLKPFESLGPRMQPTPLLLEMAKSGKPFYSPGP